MTIVFVIIISVLIGYWFGRRQLCSVDENKLKEKLPTKDYSRFVEGAKVKITKKGYDQPNYYGIISSKSIFNSWECDWAITTFRVEIYQKGRTEKVGINQFYINELELMD